MTSIPVAAASSRREFLRQDAAATDIPAAIRASKPPAVAGRISGLCRHCKEGSAPDQLTEAVLLIVTVLLFGPRTVIATLYVPLAAYLCEPDTSKCLVLAL